MNCPRHPQPEEEGLGSTLQQAPHSLLSFKHWTTTHQKLSHRIVSITQGGDRTESSSIIFQESWAVRGMPKANMGRGEKGEERSLETQVGDK